MATEDKPRQDRTGPDKTKRDKPRQDKTRPDKTRQAQTRQDKTSTDKTRQAKLRQDKTPHDLRRQDTTRRTYNTRQQQTTPDHPKRQEPKKERSGLGFSRPTFWPSLLSFSLVTTHFASSPTPYHFYLSYWWIMFIFSN